MEGLSCVLPGRAGVAAYGFLFCHPWGISIRTRGVLRSWITYFGGLTSPPAPFFGFAGFLIKVVSAELRKQWFLLHGNYCYGSQACRVRVAAFCKTIMKKKIFFVLKEGWDSDLLCWLRKLGLYSCCQYLNLLSWNFGFWSSFSPDRKASLFFVLQHPSWGPSIPGRSGRLQNCWGVLMLCSCIKKVGYSESCLVTGCSVLPLFLVSSFS